MFSQIFGRSSTQGESSIKWKNLTDESQIDQIINESASKPILIFKHSLTCGTSAMALDRLERNWDGDEASEINPYFLDLLTYRSVSNLIAEKFGVWHQSPQVLIIHQGKCVYDISHMGISYNQIIETVSNLGSV